ncbi:MAG: hypothetical protein HKN11_07610 [Rhizobiales bacterium]|nr:hypothetical protein [Hyphomicrobiales bacterium]
MSDQKLIEPIILMCSERSGSNLITRMFDAHPEVAAPGTSHIMYVLSENAWKYGANHSTLQRDLPDIFRAKISSWLIDEMPPDQLRALSRGADSVPAVIAGLLKAELSAEGKSLYS